MVGLEWDGDGREVSGVVDEFVCGLFWEGDE